MNFIIGSLRRTQLLQVEFTFKKRLYCHKIPHQPGSRYVKPLSGIRKYFIGKCIQFIRGYEHILERNFPKAYRIYQVFAIGTRDLYLDIKEYIKISSALRHGKSVRDLKRKELENYFKIPKDLIKVGPVLLVAALPFANYVILPIIYLFPKHFLTSHFWSLQQKVDFAVQLQRKKLFYYRPVFRHLQAKCETINDNAKETNCFNILSKIGSGTHPSIEEILKVKSLFIEPPYGLNFLSSLHLHSLCRMHGLSILPGKRLRLWHHAGFVREMDLAIRREGLESMDQNDLRLACFLRGLSPIGLKKSEMIEWLNKWVIIAQNIDSTGLSLLLHCPILLSYNQTTNWVLIH